VNAVVGALRASIDDSRHWDIVGLSTFAVLTGLGGGFIHLSGDSVDTSTTVPANEGRIEGALDEASPQDQPV
jgi:hypothetical protein